MPFEIPTPTTVTLTSATPRTETHGDDRVIAISLGLKLSGANTLLDAIGPTLRHTLYKAVEGQDVLPGVEETTPLLRTRGIESLTLAGALEGWTLTVDHGIDEDNPITLGGCKVDKFRVSPHEGGTVDILFRVGTSDVDAEELGLLCSKLSQDISITLTAPVKSATLIDGTGAEFKKDHPEAGDLFAEQIGSEQHAGDFGTTEDDADTLNEGEDHEGEPEQLDGEGGSDSEGGETDIGADVAAFEEGLQRSSAAAGLVPKGRRGRARLAAVE